MNKTSNVLRLEKSRWIAQQTTKQHQLPLTTTITI